MRRKPPVIESHGGIPLTKPYPYLFRIVKAKIHGSRQRYGQRVVLVAIRPDDKLEIAYGGRSYAVSATEPGILVMQQNPYCGDRLNLCSVIWNRQPQTSLMGPNTVTGVKLNDEVVSLPVVSAEPDTNGEPDRSVPPSQHFLVDHL